MTAATIVAALVQAGRTSVTIRDVMTLAAALKEEKAAAAERYCSEGCGRELWPHEDIWCGVCGSGDDPEDRPATVSTRGTFGAFVLPTDEQIDQLLGLRSAGGEATTG